MGTVANREFSMATLQLQKGDKLILYTDGLLQAPAKLGRQVMRASDLQKAVESIIAVNPQICVTQLIHEVFQQVGGMTLSAAATTGGYADDIAILGLELESKIEFVEDIIHPNNLEELRQWRKQIYNKIQSEWVSRSFEKPEQRLRVSMEETLLNAWNHGNQQSPKKAIRVKRSYGNDAQFSVLNEGDGFDYDRLYDPTSHENRIRPSGRGLYLVRHYADQVLWQDEGRQISLYFGRYVSGEKSRRKENRLWTSLWQK
jgi:anti-sigma regulatory factor (Ser/Thr protein kinase)